jgi:hypothetical protein
MMRFGVIVPKFPVARSVGSAAEFDGRPFAEMFSPGKAFACVCPSESRNLGVL